ncbi:MAG: RNA repair domain-containing protein [Thermoplasmata archaeon]
MSKRIYPRDVLNRLKWEEGKSLEQVEVVILHRGAPNDRRTILGRDIARIGQTFFETSETSIPYHRVLEIRCDGKVLFEKRTKQNKDSK